MKLCELCGLENPHEARFCMKCGKDLDAVRSTESFFDVPEGGAFTPQGSPDDATLRAVTPESDPEAPHGTDSAVDSGVNRILQAEYAKAAAMDFGEFEEVESEIRQVESATGTGDRHEVCEACGVVNPHEQRYCKSCGSALSASGHGGGDGSTNGESGWNLDGLYDAQDASGGAGVDDFYNQYASVPLAAEEPLVPLVETSLFAPVSPSSDYYSSDISTRKRRKTRGKIEWGARDWMILIGLTLVLLAGIWLFFLGGMDLFSGKVRNLKKAGQGMSQLKSFEYTSNGSMESEQAGEFTGSGGVKFESPDRSAWQFTTTIPGKPPVLTQQSQVAGKRYVNGGGSWTLADPESALPDVKGLWSGFSSVEDLGQTTCGGSQCFHYKYRTPPGTLTGMLGVWKPSGASDAVVEAWIDTSNHRIVKLTAQIYNVQLEGMRTSVSLTFDLTAVDRKYDIKAPI